MYIDAYIDIYMYIDVYIYTFGKTVYLAGVYIYIYVYIYMYTYIYLPGRGMSWQNHCATGSLR